MTYPAPAHQRHTPPRPTCSVCGSAAGPFVTGVYTPHPETGEDPEITTYCTGCSPFIGPDEEDFSEELKAVTPQPASIRIGNVRHLALAPGETAIYCGRGDAPGNMEHAHLGNPFRVSGRYAQGEAADAYLPYLQRRCREKQSELATITALARRLNAGEALVLTCWCAPEPCHTRHIMAAVQGYAARFRGQ